MKRIVLGLVMVGLVSVGAFAQLTFGVSAVQYYPENPDGTMPSVQQAWEDFKTGDNMYYGGTAEIIFSKLGLGFSFNYSPSFDDNGDPIDDQYAYDANGYLAYHLFGGRAFIDPILQAGFGVMAYDYSDKEAYIAAGNYADQDDPLSASLYWDAGLGLGVNLGPVGIYAKVMFNTIIPDSYKGTDDVTNMEYYIPPFDPLPIKWIFGGKIIL
jgi:hypothetical protein